MNKLLVMLILLVVSTCLFAQTPNGDSANKTVTTFSGSVGFSSNGFSIVPTFSLNSPASMILLSVRRNKFSFDPDIRLVPDATKGSMIFWFRYHAITKGKYSLRVGIHPAVNIQTREIQISGQTTTISQLRRFIAWEVSNDYKFSKHFNAGIYYLQGNGLQKDGARTTHFIALNTSVSNIHVSKNLGISFSPTFYHLYLDGQSGNYISGAVTLSHQKIPFTLQHAFNQTIHSNITGNQDYMWNVSIHYQFSKKYKRI
jgi:hypothetical protein